MMKAILKFFLPKASTFATIASESICKNVNATNKADIIAKYTSYAEDITKIQAQLVEWLKDGTLDKKEEKEIAELLTPVFQKMIDLI